MAGLFNVFRSNTTPVHWEDVKDKRIVINKRRCPQNHPCPSIRVCPSNALKQTGYAAPSVDMEACIKCGKCIRYCPMRAIAFE